MSGMYRYINENLFQFKKRDIIYIFYGFCYGYLVFYSVLLIPISEKVGKCPAVFVPKPTVYNYNKPVHEFLLIAVMSSRKYLKTRARDIDATWGRHVPGNLLYFVGGSEPYDGDLPVVTLNHVNDTMYPPQKKSLSMLKYIATNLVDSYEWVMRADDDVYLKTDKLENLLRTVNSSKMLYMGQPGLGTVKEKGKIGLSTPFCMGGPGIYFTKSTLLKIRDHIDECIGDTVTLHEDTELGRCVYKFAGVYCSCSYELKEMFVHNNFHRFETYNQTLGEADERAITLHPIKINPHMYRIHSHFLTIQMDNLKAKIASRTNEIEEMDRLLSEKANQQPNRMRASRVKRAANNINNEADYKSRLLEVDKFDRSEWDFIGKNNRIYSRHNMYHHVTDVSISLSSKYQSKNMSEKAIVLGSTYPVKPLPISYLRLTGGKLMGLVSVKKIQKQTLLTERTVQRLSGIYSYELKTSTTSTIWMVLPVYRRAHQFDRFLTMIPRAVEKFNGIVKLQIALYYDEDGEHVKTRNILELKSKLSEKVHVNVTYVNMTFSKAWALNLGFAGLPDESLILLMDVDMYFDHNFLNRVIRNTIYNKQVFFPICFSQFDPRIICFANKNDCNAPPTNFNNQFGVWRTFGFGIVGIYKADMDRIGGLNYNIKGWGFEDDDLYDKCIHSDMHVFRAVDPFLVHIFHRKYCDKKLTKAQYTTCAASRNQVGGHYKTLLDIADRLKLIPD